MSSKSGNTQAYEPDSHTERSNPGDRDRDSNNHKTRDRDADRDKSRYVDDEHDRSKTSYDRSRPNDRPRGRDKEYPRDRVREYSRDRDRDRDRERGRDRDRGRDSDRYQYDSRKRHGMDTNDDYHSKRRRRDRSSSHSPSRGSTNSIKVDHRLQNVAFGERGKVLDQLRAEEELDKKKNLTIAQVAQLAKKSETEAMALMGITTSFQSTSGKQVKGNCPGYAAVRQVRTYRQYMNRLGGFSRALDKV